MKTKYKILILGGGGYLGQSIIKLFSKKRSFEVAVIDRYFYIDREKLIKSKNIKYFKEDIRRTNEKYFKKINFVIDLSNVSIAPQNHKFYDEMSWEINFEGRKNNLLLAKKNNIKKYLFPSSCSVYGFNLSKKYLNENSQLNPKSTYAKTHKAFEKFALDHGNNNFEVISLRLPTLFGFSRRIRFDLIINAMVWDVLETGKINLLRDGKQRRPFVHVNDVAEAFLFFIKLKNIKANNNVFNIGNNINNINILNLAKKIFKILNVKENISWYGTTDDRSYFVSFNKVNALGFKPLRTIEDGILELKMIYKKNKFLRTHETMNMKWLDYLEKIKNSKKNSEEDLKILKKKKMYGGILKIKGF